jgi:hypothetical protein
MFVKGASRVAGAEQRPLVSAEQELEACQVGPERCGVVGAAADEAAQRGG